MGIYGNLSVDRFVETRVTACSLPMFVCARAGADSLQLKNQHTVRRARNLQIIGGSSSRRVAQERLRGGVEKRSRTQE